MKWIKYSKYTGEDLGISAEDLLKALSDFLLESGFNSQYMPFSEWNQHTLEDLKKAIQQALEHGKLFDNERSPGNDGARRAHDAGADGCAAGKAGAEDGGRGADHDRGTGWPRRRRAEDAERTKSVRGHRQVARLPGIQDAEGSAGVARQEQLRPPRYARSGDRHRGQRFLEGSTNSATR